MTDFFGCHIHDEHYKCILVLSQNTQFQTFVTSQFVNVMTPRVVSEGGELFGCLGFETEKICQYSVKNSDVFLVDGKMFGGIIGVISEIISNYMKPYQVIDIPTFVFVGVPCGADFEKMKEVLEGSGYSSNELIVMCQIGEGIAFVFDMKAPEWVEEAAVRLKNECAEGVSACVGAFIVTSRTFTLRTIDRPYVLFPLGNALIVRWPMGEDPNLMGVDMREWEVAEFGTDSLFRGSFNLRFVSLPVPLKRINEYTFSRCESLECASLMDCPSLGRIGAGAFYGCTLLGKVIVPASVTDVEFMAFANSGLRLFDVSRCPAASFEGWTAAGSLLDEAITSFDSCEAVCRVGTKIVEGT
jgi:hypothetical protein